MEKPIPTEWKVYHTDAMVNPFKPDHVVKRPAPSMGDGPNGLNGPFAVSLVVTVVLPTEIGHVTNQRHLTAEKSAAVSTLKRKSALSQGLVLLMAAGPTGPLGHPAASAADLEELPLGKENATNQLRPMGESHAMGTQRKSGAAAKTHVLSMVPGVRGLLGPTHHALVVLVVLSTALATAIIQLLCLEDKIAKGHLSTLAQFTFHHAQSTEVGPNGHLGPAVALLAETMVLF